MGNSELHSRVDAQVDGPELDLVGLQPAARERELEVIDRRGPPPRVVTLHDAELNELIVGSDRQEAPRGAPDPTNDL